MVSVHKCVWCVRLCVVCAFVCGVPCRQFVADISFPTPAVGTCGGASHTYRGSSCGHFTGSKVAGEGKREEGSEGRKKMARQKEKTMRKRKMKQSVILSFSPGNWLWQGHFKDIPVTSQFPRRG